MRAMTAWAVTLAVLAGCATSPDDQATSASTPAQAYPALPLIDATPIVRVQPVYPRAAVDDDLQGCVAAALLIDPDGTVADTVVAESRPAGVFDATSHRAWTQWKFAPPSARGWRMQTLTFNLAAIDAEPPECRSDWSAADLAAATGLEIIE